MLFIKLGGSLITDKTRENAPRVAILSRLAYELSDALRLHPQPILLGHGSGSFGHVAAKKYGTRAGVHSAEDWRGFSHVSVVAAQINRIVADAMLAAHVPVMSFLPSALVTCHNGVITNIKHDGIATALEHGLVPMVMGDVAFDTQRGGTIVSCEEVFGSLASQLSVTRILLAGETEGVYEKYPDGAIIPTLTPADWEHKRGGIGGSRGADVTGGMASKVRDMLNLVQTNPALTVHIFSGLAEGNLARAIAGETIGTTIQHDRHP
jgi:isopentenyl phosphate kinase